MWKGLVSLTETALALGLPNTTLLQLACVLSNAIF